MRRVARTSDEDRGVGGEVSGQRRHVGQRAVLLAAQDDGEDDKADERAAEAGKLGACEGGERDRGHGEADPGQ
jgi:hypothetical protein